MKLLVLMTEPNGCNSLKVREIVSFLNVFVLRHFTPSIILEELNIKRELIKE